MGFDRIVKRGDIWQVNLDPTIGHEIQKSRPAVIIQNDVGNEHSPITIIAPLTTQGLEKVYPVEVLLTEDNSTIERVSKVLLDQIRAIDKKRLIRKEGTVTKQTMREVNEAIRISLGLDDL